MQSTLIPKLKQQIERLRAQGIANELVLINHLKESLQHYVLEYLYNHPDYARLVMYGGTLLRIGYGLPRMSEDLDFESAVRIVPEQLKQDLERHFRDKIGLALDVSFNDRPASNTQLFRLNFDVLAAFGFESVRWTVLRLRMDINHFPQLNQRPQDTLSVVQGELVYQLRTYPFSTLMASKVLAVLKRNERSIAGKTSSCKPRDIYDLLWYMERQGQPDLEYLRMKGESYENMRELLDELQLRVANLPDDLFEADLAQFFYDPSEYIDWFAGWRERFGQLIRQYKTYQVGEIDEVRFRTDFDTRGRSIHYWYHTQGADDQIGVRFVVRLSSSWFIDKRLRPKRLYPIHEIDDLIQSPEQPLTDLDRDYIDLFYRKIESYLDQKKRIVSVSQQRSKLIKATAKGLNPIAELQLDRRLLEDCKWEDLL